MESVLVNESRWPLVVVKTPPRATSDVVKELAAAMDGLFARRQRFGIVIDTRSTSLPRADTRSELAQYQRLRDQDFVRWIVADANIVGSAAMRGAITAINWLSPPNHPTRVFTSLDDGIQWVGDLLALEYGAAAAPGRPRTKP